MGLLNTYAGTDLDYLASAMTKEGRRKLEEDQRKNDEFKKNVKAGGTFGNEEVSRALDQGYSADDINRYLKASGEKPSGNFAVGGYRTTSEIRGAGDGQAQFDVLKDPYWIAVAPPTRREPERQQDSPVAAPPAPVAEPPAAVPVEPPRRPDPFDYGAMTRPESSSAASIYGDNGGSSSAAESLAPERGSFGDSASSSAQQEKSDGTDWQKWLSRDDKDEPSLSEELSKQRQYTPLGQPLAGSLWG